MSHAAPHKPHFFSLVALMGSLLAVACGGTAPAPQMAEPLPAELEMTYENGADFVDDPEILEGQWREDWSRELDERVRTADVIGVVRIPTIRTDIDPEGRTTFRLIAESVRSVLGEDPNVELTVSEGQDGYAGIESNQRRLQSTEMVLFLRWALGEDGEVEARWHLSPASEGVVSRVEYLAERRRGVEREGNPGRVIVHQH